VKSIEDQWSLVMKNLISRASDRIGSLLQAFQVKRFLAVVLVGFLLLTTNVSPGHNNKGLTNEVRDQLHQDDSQRPKTTREWYEEARETNDAPGERIKRIAGESAEAFKEFGSGYVEGAKKTARDVGEGLVDAGKDLTK
jgi:hypothetical protein